MRLITYVTIIILLSACETVTTKSSSGNNLTALEQRGVEPKLVSSSTPANQSLMALVIGNTKYEYGSLINPVNDATDIAAVLRQIGFKVTLKTNLDQVGMGSAIRQFTARLSSQSIGLFYFAGHGTQVDGRNYLLPIDNNKIEDKHDLSAYAIDVNQQVLTRMEENRSHLNIVILDACRNDPYRSTSRGDGRGLASIQSRQGSIIAFATSPGKTAADSSAGKRNGLYTKYLLKGLKRAHQTHQRIDDMLMQVGNGVTQESGRTQEPWYNASLKAPFCFGGCQASSLISNKQEKNELTAESGTKFDPLKLLHQKAEEGDVYAQSQLGRMYEYGRNVQKDYKKAIKWYRLAAKQGNANAQDGLGHMYWTGTGIQKDYQKALKWFRLSAKQGLSRGQKNLGWMYSEGNGVPQDYKEAIKWFRLAAKQKNSNAQALMGEMYLFGRGVPKDYKEAAKWYRLSAENKSHKTPYGAYVLGGLYEIGKGVSQDYNEAIRWYRIAAQRGYSQALEALIRLEEK
jgi:TPR repeat protein